MKENKLPYHKPGFKVPTGYFGEFEERIMRTVSQEGTTGNRPTGRAGFTVPQDYFEELEDKILHKIQIKEDDNKVVSIFRKKSIYYAATAAAVFLAIITTVLYDPSIPEYTIDSIELSVLEDYIDEGYIDLNYNEISAYITEEGHYGEHFNTANISDDEVFEYLNEHLEDPELLFE